MFTVLFPADIDPASLSKMALAGSGCNVKKSTGGRVRATNAKPQPHKSVASAGYVAFMQPLTTSWSASIASAAPPRTAMRRIRELPSDKGADKRHTSKAIGFVFA
ncbi:hypothetical protein [Hoeflea sp.]|uniref:hypothetical protein n=1 Tax=Hoeflea sp. TaxID=1940281 RepID=UPI003BAE1837